MGDPKEIGTQTEIKIGYPKVKEKPQNFLASLCGVSVVPQVGDIFSPKPISILSAEKTDKNTVKQPEIRSLEL